MTIPVGKSVEPLQYGDTGATTPGETHRLLGSR